MRYSRALRAIEKILAKSDQQLHDFSLHSLRILGATRLAAGGLQLIQTETKKYDADMAYTRNNRVFEGDVSRW